MESSVCKSVVHVSLHLRRTMPSICARKTMDKLHVPYIVLAIDDVDVYMEPDQARAVIDVLERALEGDTHE